MRDDSQNDHARIIAAAAAKARETASSSDHLKTAANIRTSPKEGRPLSERESEMLKCATDTVLARVEELLAVLRRAG